MYNMLLTLIVNPIHMFLLRSPFHRLVSHRMILLTFYGRKSGARYSFPLYYVRTGEDIRFFTSRTGRWWLNLLRGTWVRVRLQGVDYAGIAEHVPASHVRMVDALVAFDRGLTKEEAEKIADNRVMFNIRLQTEPEAVPHRVPGIG
jgi:hypothetical protein